MESELSNFNSDIVIRTGKPHAFDQAPYGTVCKVITHGETFDLYVQLSHTESNPQWSIFGTFPITLSDKDILSIKEAILKPEK